VEIGGGRHGRDGPKTYTYWMASWREDGKVRTVYLGSTRKMDAETALQKARAIKTAAQQDALVRTTCTSSSPSPPWRGI
jgi:hypothetical protein